jgi:hypothetical protein
MFRQRRNRYGRLLPARYNDGQEVVQVCMTCFSQTLGALLDRSGGELRCGFMNESLPSQPGPDRAWKFLDDRGQGMVSGFRWPVPRSAGGVGDWVEAGGPVEVCVCGIHACRIDDLAWWLSAQLWEMELAGEHLEDDHAVVAARGRLVRRVDQWPAVGEELAAWAIWRSRDRAADVMAGNNTGAAEEVRAASTLEELGDVVDALPQELDQPSGVAVALVASQLKFPTNPVLACITGAQAAAHAAIVGASASQSDAKPAFALERTLQSRWLADRLGLVR